MNLYLNQASPYARLIRILLVETELDTETEMIFVDPWESPDELLMANPASKVPALTLKDGTRLVESACIGDYLIQYSGQSALSPMSHLDSETRLQILGLGRAALDWTMARHVAAHCRSPGGTLCPEIINRRRSGRPDRRRRVRVYRFSASRNSVAESSAPSRRPGQFSRTADIP